jgi:hypothetical protein
MSFRAKRPGDLEEDALNRADTRVRALPTKNTFIEFPVSVGQLDSLQSPVSDHGLRPYTTPAWMQSEPLRDTVARAAAASPRAADCCTRTPSPSVRDTLRDARLFDASTPPAFEPTPAAQTSAAVAQQELQIPWSPQPSMGNNSYVQDSSPYGNGMTDYTPQFVYTVPAFDTQGSNSSFDATSTYQPGFNGGGAYVEQAAWG